MDTFSRSSARSDATAPAEFSTTNAKLAALLACNGIAPSRVEPPTAGVYPAYASFVFPHSPALHAAIGVWESNATTLLNPREYSRHLMELQRTAREAARGGGR